jgi:hypothetical protein
VFAHPAAFVPVTVYIVVEAGLATGFEQVAHESPELGNQV